MIGDETASGPAAAPEDGAEPEINRTKPAAPPRRKAALSAAQSVDRAKARKAARKKTGRRKLYWLGGLGLFTLIMYVGMQPIKGSTRYGVCRTFIELQLRYPNTLQVNAVDESALAVRVYFSHVDAFGSSQLNMVECEFRTDPRRGTVLNAVTLNRREIAKEQVEAFNYTVPFVMQNPPDLVLPRLRSDALVDLKIDYY